MSVRRLAKEQPASFAFSKATKQKADWWIAKYPADIQQEVYNDHFAEGCYNSWKTARIKEIAGK